MLKRTVMNCSRLCAYNPLVFSWAQAENLYLLYEIKRINLPKKQPDKERTKNEKIIDMVDKARIILEHILYTEIW